MTDYVRVPVEPTEEMMDAGDRACVDGLMRATAGLPPKHATHASHEVYRAMLSAAPQAIAPEGMLVEPPYYDNDGYRCETGVKPKFVLKDDYDALRAYALSLEAKVKFEFDIATGYHKRWQDAESLLRAGERDGERYRWLRDEANDYPHDYRLRIFDGLGVMASGEDFDRAIDQAMTDQSNDPAALDSAMERKKEER